MADGGGCVASTIVVAATEVGFSLVWVGSGPVVLPGISWDSVKGPTCMSTEVSWADKNDEWMERRVGIGFCNVKTDDCTNCMVEPAADACVMAVDLRLAVKD